MNRDNLLYALLGLVIGFISAYWMFEAMAVRQPARLVPGQMAAAPQGGGMGQGAPEGAGGPGMGAGAPGGGQPDGQAMMNEISNLRAQIEKDPNDASAVLKLANANFDIQRWDTARELYARYLELRPKESNVPDVMTDLGVTYRALGQYDQALEMFQEAQKVAPEHWQSRFNEVIVLAFDLKQFDRANAVLAELRRLKPGDPDVDQLAAEVEKQRNAA